jgi:tRNA1(Val) A37 N6-methylase TrmN6
MRLAGAAQIALSDPEEDAFLDGRVRLLQPDSGYRAAIDPIFLAAAVSAKDRQAVLDVGCGVGTAMLCLARRLPAVRVTGLDVQQELIDLAHRNIALNAMEDRLEAVVGDVAAPPPSIKSGSFDYAMANPPHLDAAQVRPPPNAVKAMANVEGAAGLDAWMTFCVRAVRPNGRVTLIHRADRLDDVLAAMAGRLGGIAVFPLWPGSEGKDARRVLVQGIKGSAAPLRLCRGLVLHEPGGAFTAAADAVLHGGQGLIF